MWFNFQLPLWRLWSWPCKRIFSPDDELLNEVGLWQNIVATTKELLRAIEHPVMKTQAARKFEKLEASYWNQGEASSRLTVHVKEIRASPEQVDYFETRMGNGSWSLLLIWVFVLIWQLSYIPLELVWH